MIQEKLAGKKYIYENYFFAAVYEELDFRRKLTTYQKRKLVRMLPGRAYQCKYELTESK